MSVAADVVVVIVAVAASAPKLFFFGLFVYCNTRVGVVLSSSCLRLCYAVCVGACVCRSSELREFCSVYSPADLYSLVK